MNSTRDVWKYWIYGNLLQNDNIMNEDEKKIYDRALVKYSTIVRCGGNSIEEIRECIGIFEEFEDYEKCADLLEILKAYESKK